MRLNWTKTKRSEGHCPEHAGNVCKSIITTAGMGQGTPDGWVGPSLIWGDELQDMNHQTLKIN